MPSLEIVQVYQTQLRSLRTRYRSTFMPNGLIWDKRIQFIEDHSLLGMPRGDGPSAMVSTSSCDLQIVAKHHPHCLVAAARSSFRHCTLMIACILVKFSHPEICITLPLAAWCTFSPSQVKVHKLQSHSTPRNSNHKG